MRPVPGVVIVSVVGFAACQSQQRTLPSPRVGLRLTTTEVARQHSRHMQHIDAPFRLVENGVNGTGILIAYLQRLETYGAVYVAELSYALQLTHDGVAMECVSKIAVDDGRRAAAAQAEADEGDGEPEYTTTIKPWRPRASDAWVVDRDMVCKQRAQQVAVAEPRYDNTYNAEILRFMPPGSMPIENTAIVFYDQCSYEPSRRYVHRYEHFLAARFSPPDLEIVRRSYADLPLVHEPPLCHQIQLAPGQGFRQHIQADVYFPTTIEPVRENDTLLVEPVPSQGGDG